MIIGVEGLSRVGKTTFINKYLEKYPETIRFRGAGGVNIGMEKRWQEYNFWMHNNIEQLDKLNNFKFDILWDRFISDAVHSEDRSYASEILRIMKSHKRKAIIYIKAPLDILEKRGSKEGAELKLHQSRYETTLLAFDTLTIDLAEGGPTVSNVTEDYYITDSIIEQAHEYIEKVRKSYGEV